MYPSAHEQDLLDLALDGMAISDLPERKPPCRSPLEMFDRVLCSSQIISQIAIELCDQSTLTNGIAPLSINEASFGRGLASIHQARSLQPMATQRRRPGHYFYF
jgi:hypothetical protein